MNTYYGLALDSKGNAKLVSNLSGSRAVAEKELKDLCKKAGLVYGSLRPTGNKKSGGSTLTKYAKARKVKNGKAGRILD
ncbi:hypothetical protein NV379_01880 [Paenibacillus sp. N1-5-1-14]|uniref:hypothetical protein n=1 Tax=Paenibacillus radicibacter TaxID=2972488 RepID=UPI002158FB1D|nr:hypothetical protein [Paenibacillus radicibacter]MCR8641394.1 hypothetical protein [Paenibacillus radicibacter]